MDPITVIATALALGAAAGLKPTAEQAIKDAYAGLKTLIKKKYSTVSVDQLEKEPESKARRSVVEEDLAGTPADNDDELLAQARKLLAAIHTHAPEAAATIGVRLAYFKGVGVTIEDVTTSGTAVDISHSELSSDLNIKNVRAGKTEDPPKS